MPDILCTTSFTNEEMDSIEELSSLFGITPDEVVRKAVNDFSAVCVPTQDGSPANA